MLLFQRFLVAIAFCIGFLGTLGTEAAADAVGLRESVPPQQMRLGADVDRLLSIGAVFSDAMKQASPWKSATPLVVDRLGNVVALRPGQVAETVIYASYPAGTYVLSYDGIGSFEVAPHSGTVVDRRPGRVVIRVVSGQAYGIRLRITAASPRDYPRNLRLLAGGRTTPSLFTESFLNALRSYDVVRFDASPAPMLAGGRSWASRTQVDAFTQAGPSGIAPEYAVALANAGGSNPWFTLPLDASDEYVSRLADLVARSLDPRLRPIFEYGGDVWRSSGDIARPGEVQARLDSSPIAAAWYAARAKSVFALIDSAFRRAQTRPLRVLSGRLITSAADAAFDSAIVGSGGIASRIDALAVPVDVRAEFTPLQAIPFSQLLASGVARTVDFASRSRLALFGYESSASAQARSSAEAEIPSFLRLWQTLGGGAFVVSKSGTDSATSSALRAATVLSGSSAVGLGTVRAESVAAHSGTATVAVAAGNTLVSQSAGRTLINEPFSRSSTYPKSWLTGGDACLTAGTAATPLSSIRPCNGTASRDPESLGALQLTNSGENRRGFVVDRTPIATAAGLQVTFTPYSLHDGARGGDGLTLFFADASQLLPLAPSHTDGDLGYGSAGGSGIAHAYLGIGFDERAFIAAPKASEASIGMATLAVRGAATARYPYLGGSVTADGAPAALPLSSKRADAPTVRAILLPNGLLTVALDRHDGRGFIAYYRHSIPGVGRQPSVPPALYVGLSAGTSRAGTRYRVADLSVSTLEPMTSFVPTQVQNLAGWFDASDATSVAQTVSGGVSAWNDKSGNGNGATQQYAYLQPAYVDSGINGLGSLAFNGHSALFGSNTTFAKSLLNESTVFIVSSEAAATQRSMLLYAGAYHADPHWALHPSDDQKTAVFDFNGLAAGRVTALDVPGTAIWTAAGSLSNKMLFLRKNGNALASAVPSGGTVAGNYPFAIGEMWDGAATGSYAFDGSIGEIVAYDRFLSPTETSEIEGYLACKWGLQNRLPANHPYRNSCPQGGSPSSIPTPAPTGSALPEPPELRSQGGSLTFNVTAQADPSTGNPIFNYAGSKVPPTLRLLPGDTLYVNLTNNLPKPPPGATYLNNTNLHYHGLHVSPNAPSDDSIDVVAAPGQTLHYVVKIPTTHPPGLYWYHSHAHAESERQNLSGMSGALVIEGISQYAPEVANLPERILIVRDAEPAGTPLPLADPAQLDAMRWASEHANASATRAKANAGSSMSGMDMSGTNMTNMEVRGTTTAQTRNPYVFTNALFRQTVGPLVASSHCQGPETASKVWTVNGATQPSIGIRPGEQQFWRLVNAGSDTYLDVALDGATMKIVALDGVPLVEGVNTPTSMSVSHYVVPPASRIEFVVTGPPGSTSAYLRTNCFDAGSSGVAMPAAILASVNPSSSPTDLVVHRERVGTRSRAAHIHSAAFIKSQAIAAQQTIYYSDQLTINGQSYDPAAPPLLYAQSGTVQEWTIVNTDTQVHTFHIHQIHFIVEAIDGIDQAQQFVMDNVNVPPATTSGPGTVKLLLDFTDPLVVGTFLLHCHILSHEDAGMMAKIRVGTASAMALSPSQVTFASPVAKAQNVTISGGKAPFSISGSGCATVAAGVLSGDIVTVTPKGAGSCLLGVADSTGLTGSVSVTVQGATSPVTVTPNSVSFASPSAAPAQVAVNGGKLPYTATGCQGIATLSLHGQTLSVSPASSGTCSVTVSDANNATASVAVAVNAVSSGSALDNLTYHQNSSRTGWYNQEIALSPSTVTQARFGKLTTLADPGGTNIGKIHAQPLYVTGELTVDGKKHNLVVIATGTDQLYAFDDQTYKVVWHRSFTNPAAGVTQQSWQDTGCYGPSPDVGIVGTPVIDRTLDRLYVVAATKENGTFHLRLHAVSMSSGAEAVDGSGRQVGPTDLTATVPLTSGGTASVDPEYNLQRPGLLEANGNIYVGLGSKCDFHTSSVHGWMLAYSATTLAQTGNSLATTDRNDGTNQFLGSVWMSGFGPAADAQGNVYFATGNGPYDGSANFSMSVVEAPGNLDMSKAQHFTPYYESADSASDADLGSGGVMLLPNQPGTVPRLAVAGGKCGAGSKNGGTNGCMKYLLNRDVLGGQKQGDAGAVWQANTAGYMWGGPAFFADTTGSYVVYGGGVSYAPLSTYLIGNSPPSLKIATSQGSLSCLECRLGGSQPIVSSSGTQAGTSIVWALQTPGQKGGTISLYAFNGSKMSQILFSGVAGNWTIASGAASIGSALVSPMVANGKVYVPVDNGVAVFGLGG